MFSIRARTQALLAGAQAPVDQTSPAIPATCGAAIEVPLSVPYPTPLPKMVLGWVGAVERIETPGAATSTQPAP